MIAVPIRLLTLIINPYILIFIIGLSIGIATFPDPLSITAFLTAVGTGLGIGIGVLITRIAKAKAEARKITDESMKESLSAKLESMSIESNQNQEKMRTTLHEINNLLNARNLENQYLQDSLHEANENFIRVSRELNRANDRIGQLTAEVARLTAADHQLNQTVSEQTKQTEVLVNRVLGTEDQAQAGPRL